ncbi:MAG: PEP-utilizing enzyme [Patescibacteria group bacterium]|nr:PEP-utilizing enzyme [Patescibacteria group bacterium]
MKWHLNVKRSAYPLDASIILESDVKSLKEAAGTSYSACFAVIEKGIAAYYAPEIEVKRQLLYLKRNFKATQRRIEGIPILCQKLLKEVKELSRMRNITISRFKNFLFLYRQFITTRIVTRVIGYDEHLDHDFLSEVAKARLNFKETWEEVRKYLGKIWQSFGGEHGISPENLKLLTIIEFLSLWQKKKLKLAQEMIIGRDSRFIILRQTDKEIILTGKKADDFLKKNLPQEEAGNVNFIQGRPAFGGYAKGRVKAIDIAAGASLRKRFILVTSMTTPDFVPLLKMADAIVTDEGGLTCHAAIISRELKIPCIVGTKIATKVLHDGDLVEVDADKGVVKIIKRK